MCETNNGEALFVRSRRIWRHSDKSSSWAPRYIPEEGSPYHSSAKSTCLFYGPYVFIVWALNIETIVLFVSHRWQYGSYDKKPRLGSVSENGEKESIALSN